MRDFLGLQCASGILCMENFKANTLGKSVQMPYTIEVRSEGSQVRGRFSITNNIQSDNSGLTLSSGGEDAHFERDSIIATFLRISSRIQGKSLVNQTTTGYGDVCLSLQNGNVQGHTHYFQWIHQEQKISRHWFIDGTIQGDTIEVMVGSRKGSLFGFLNRHTFPVKSYRGNFSTTQTCLNLGKNSRLFFKEQRVSGQLIGSDQQWKIKVDVSYEHMVKPMMALMIFMMGNEIFYEQWNDSF